VGIRVHKKLGYGLTDIQTKEGAGWQITDERVNLDAAPFKSGKECPSIEEYREWLEAQRKEGDIEVDLELSFLREPEPGGPKHSLDYAVTHEGEYGLPNVLLITPPTYERTWSRMDNAIDYIEETYLRKDVKDPCENRADVLRHGIYPFIGYMDRRTGEKVDDRIFNWIRATNTSTPLPEGELDLVAEACGFESSKDAWENVAPIIPNDIKNLANFLDLFTSPDVLLQLRPILYTYWS